MTTDTTSDAQRAMTDGGGEELYEHVTVVKTLEDDPVNDRESGWMWFVEGRHPDGDDYKVWPEDEQLTAISTEAVLTIRLTDQLPKREAIETARTQAKELVDLAPDTEDGESDE